MNLVRSIRYLALLSAPFAPAAWGAEYQYSSKFDPGMFCEKVEKRLPQKIGALRKLDRLVAETASPDQDYCLAEPLRCEIRGIKFPGLEGLFLLEKKTGNLSVLSLTISHSKWRTLDPLRVGASLNAVESAFAVKAESGVSTLKVIGDCAALDIDHDGKRVKKLRLDCQACI